MRRGTIIIIFVLLLFSLGCIERVETENQSQSGVEKLKVTNSAGRSGSYYLPAGYENQSLPMLVAYHGTGGNGQGMVYGFKSLADEFRFIIVAPDSRKSPQGHFTWQVGDGPGDITEDYTHTLACIDEVKAIPNVQIDPSQIIAVGHSGGASSAPYIATNEEMFTAFAVLHGGVFSGGLGNNKIPGWFSTGESDSLRPPKQVEQAADSLRQLGFLRLEVRIYPGGHGISPEEKRDVIKWWLGR